MEITGVEAREQGVRRLFLASPLSKGLREELALFLQRFRPRFETATGGGGGISWVPLQNLHLTIKFFGDVGLSGERRIVEAVERYVRDVTPFALDLHGVGTFPGASRSPRVVWFGCRGQVEEVTTAVEGLEYVLERIGWEREKRGFKPHLTIARIRRPIPASATLTSLLDDFRDERFGTWPVDEWTLFRSELLATGAVYHAVHRFPLAR